MEKLGDVLRAGYTSNLDDFTGKIEKAQVNFKPLGELIHTFTREPIPPTEEKNVSTNGHDSHVKNMNGASVLPKTYEIYACDITVPKFKEYLMKMETFILWFIDAASFVDPDDERWKFFVM